MSNALDFIPSSNFAAASLAKFLFKTGAYTASASDRIAADTGGGVFTITLPANPLAGDEVHIIDNGGAFSTNNLTIGRNGENIQNLAEDMVVSNNSVDFYMVYVDITVGWEVFGTIAQGIGAVVADTSPELGGDLDGGGNNISNVGNLIIVDGTANTREANAAATGSTITSTGHTGLQILSGSTSTGNVYFGDTESNSSLAIVADHNVGSLAFYSGATDLALTLDTSQNIILANGVSFNGDTAAANRLDDYEEGTFTPTLIGHSGGSATLGTATGHYTKIGRMVSIEIRVTATSVSGLTGNVRIGGLPFTATAVGNRGGVAVFGTIGNITSANLNNCGGSYVDGTALLMFRDTGFMVTGDLTNTASIDATFTYMT